MCKYYNHTFFVFTWAFKSFTHFLLSCSSFSFSCSREPSPINGEAKENVLLFSTCLTSSNEKSDCCGLSNVLVVTVSDEFTNCLKLFIVRILKVIFQNFKNILLKMVYIHKKLYYICFIELTIILII